MTRTHFWFPEIALYRGGVQVYCRTLLNAYHECFPEDSLHVILKNDCPEGFPKNAEKIRYSFCGRWPILRTLVFAVKLFLHGMMERPDRIIIGHMNFTPVAALLNKLFGIRYYVVIHGIEAWRRHSLLKRWGLRHASRLLTVSRFTQKVLMDRYHFDDELFYYLPPAVDIDTFIPKEKSLSLLKEYNLSPEQPVVLSVCRLDSTEYFKGYDKVIFAIDEIRQTIPDVRYILVGRGDDMPRLRNLVNHKNLQRHVYFAGFVPDEDLCDMYNLCDVFALPSQKEGFGIVFCEAMSCGKPVLAGNQDASVDTLLGGEGGALVDPNDQEAITQALLQLLQKKHPKKEVFQPAHQRQLMIENYSLDQFRKRLSQFMAKEGSR